MMVFSMVSGQIYYKPLTWFKAILGRIPVLNHHFSDVLQRVGLCLTKPPFGVTSAEVFIKCTEGISFQINIIEELNWNPKLDRNS